MEQVEQIKNKTDIVELIGDRITLKKAGRNFKGLCPFHGEKSPSFMVSPERQSFKCFGCGEGGDAYTFLQKYEGMSFLESLEHLAGKTGVKIERYRPTVQDLQKKRLVEVVHMASEYYTWILNNHDSASEVRAYLKSRKIKSEAIKHFGLGYAPEQWRSVSDFLVRKKNYTVDELESAGLVLKSEKGHYDRFRGRLMFPLKDHKGMVVGFSGRVLEADTKHPSTRSGQVAKYINSPETQLYHKGDMLYGLYENREYIRKADAIVMVEGELDMIPSWQAGVKNVVAIKGSAFTGEQARLITRHTNNVVLALDADEAGKEAMKRAVNVAEEIDLSIRVVQIQGGKDPGDVATESAKNWREMVKNASSYYDFYIDSAFAKYSTGSANDARKIAEEVVPALSRITNLVVQAHYVKLLAGRLELPEKAIYEEMERFKRKQDLKKLKVKVKAIEERKTSRRDQVEEYFLSLALQNYSKVREMIVQVEEEWVGLPSVAKILIAMKGWKKKTFEIAEFGSKLPEELQAMIDKTYLKDLSEVKGLDSVKKELEVAIGEIEEMFLREGLKQASERIAEIEKKGGEGLQNLQKEFTKLSKRLSELG